MQVLDAATRMVVIPGEAVAAALPLEVALWVAPLLPLALLALLLPTSFKKWVR